MSEPAQSPPKDADQPIQSPGDDGQMDDSQDHTGAWDFDGVKEQDRWLPIANGTSQPLLLNRAHLRSANTWNQLPVS